MENILHHPPKYVNRVPQKRGGEAGLVKSLKSHRTSFRAASITIYPDVTIVKRYATPQSIYVPKHGGQRGKVTEFTRAARLAMMTYLARVHDIGNGIFLTLTYPESFPTDPKIFKRHLDTLSKRIARKCPRYGAIWRLEFQQRGAPHFHILAFGIPGNVRRFRAWLAKSWYEIVGSGDEKHLRAGVQADRIHNRAHANRYATKYSLKVSTQDKKGEYGRRWGHFGKLNVDPVWQGSVNFNQLVEFKRDVAAWLAHRRAATGLPVRSAKRMARRLRKIRTVSGWRVFGLGGMIGDSRAIPARMLRRTGVFVWRAELPLIISPLRIRRARVFARLARENAELYARML